MAYTIGGTIGPSLGGFLGTKAAAALAVAGSIIAALLSFALPKEVDGTGSKPDDDEAVESKPTRSWLAQARLVVGLTWPRECRTFCARSPSPRHMLRPDDPH